MKQIPFQDLKATNAPLMEEYVRVAGDVVRSGRYINGERLRNFERELEQILDVRYCVGVSTGLDALRLILQAYIEMGRLKKGDEVIVPANTFIATFLAVTHCGLTAVAADIDPANFCLDFKHLPLTERTKAVIPVHLYGRPCWNAEIFNGLRSRGILIIEDDAQAIGAVCSEEGFNQSRRAGNLGDAAAISFYPAKNIGAFGDAGAVATNDPRLAETVRQLANYGSLTKYHHDLCGFNCRMDEIQAALLTLKLPTLSEVTKKRDDNARLYDELIQNPEVVKPRRGPAGELSAWHQYVIMHPRRDDLRRYLKEQGIDTEIHYPVPCHRQKCFMADSSFKTFGPLPEAERIAGMILSLPIADVGEEEIRYIAEVINNYGKK